MKIKNPIADKWNLLMLVVSGLSFLASIIYVSKEIDAFALFSSADTIYAVYIYLLAFVLFLAVIFKIFEKNSFDALFLIKKIIWVFLPSEILIFYSLPQSVHFDKFPFYYALRISSIAYVILFFIYLVFCLKGYRKVSDFFKEFRNTPEAENASKNAMKKIPVVGNIFTWSKKQGLAGIVLLLAIILNLGFGFYHLSEFAAVDEPLWTYDRVPQFWKNLNEGDFKKTMVSDKPGITVALISGAGLSKVNPRDYKDIVWKGEVFKTDKDIRIMNFYMRFPILLFNVLMVFVFYLLLEKLLGKFSAALSCAFIALSPLLIGISTIINPDSILWVFTSLSIIGYFLYLKNSRNKYLYISGLFLGLALLTKYVANVLFIFYFGLIFLEYIVNNKKYKEMLLSEYFKKAFIDYAILILVSLLVFFTLLPATWVKISLLFEGTILSQAFRIVWPVFIISALFIVADTIFLRNRILSPILNFLSRYRKILASAIISIFIAFILATLADTYSGMKFYDLEAILASPKSAFLTNGFFGIMMANFYSFIFGISPLALAAILWVSIKSLLDKDLQKRDEFVWMLYLIVFVILYYIGSTVDKVSATVRYQIIIYPLVFIIAAIGIGEFVKLKYFSSWNNRNFLAFLIVIISSIYSLNYIRPFYFSYASSLLPNEHVLNLKDMGDGSFEAAQYLNKLPNAEGLIIWSDKRGVCTFFVGRCNSGFDFDKKKIAFDYFVVSSGRETRTSKMTLNRVNGGNTTLFRLDKLYDVEDPEHKIEIGGRPNNFIKVISASDIKF